ncbi:MAG: serine hydrolase [Deltaproteobacteria bacterium]|nr:serine hydrolase [Deltaproteobacteria bacterium]
MSRIRETAASLPRVFGYFLLATIATAWLVVAVGGPASSSPIQDHLDSLIEQDKAPALFTAAVGKTGITRMAAAGVRQRGWGQEVTTKDILRINSNTKAMTAAMVATLVEDGVLPKGWQTTVQEVFPGLHESYHNVTLRELLSMRSGIRKSARNWNRYGSRQEVVMHQFSGAPKVTRGEFHYSNLSFIMAAAMAEKLTGKSWETLMQERIFDPLGMASAGFGEPSERASGQPWGHIHDRDRVWVGEERPLPAVMGPAGTVSLTMEDWAKFIVLWFDDVEPKILSREVLTELTTDMRYAAGWHVRPRGTRSKRLSHGGNSRTWRSRLVVYPSGNTAYLAVATGRDRDRPRTWKMLGGVIRVVRKVR